MLSVQAEWASFQRPVSDVTVCKRAVDALPVTLSCNCGQARTRKLEAESKLAGLQKDLAELGTVSGDQAGAEEAQTMQLHQVCHAFV